MDPCVAMEVPDLKVKLPLASGTSVRMLSLGANTSDLRMPGLNLLGPKLFFFAHALKGFLPLA
jgi:sortase (surface protein transpeptidase)